MTVPNNYGVSMPIAQGLCMKIPAVVLFLALSCAVQLVHASGDVFTLLKHYPLDSRMELVPPVVQELDLKETSDGNGSLRIVTAGPVTVPLFSTGPLAVAEATLVYQAMLRCQGLEGQAYLEMLCEFKGKGEFFSRALDTALSGSSGWVLQRTPFFLKKGQQPANVKLNLVITGKGTVWVDDIRLLKGPLQ